MDNIDKIIDKLLKDNLTPAKIKAFASVISALKGSSVKQEPNAVKDLPNDEDLVEEKRLDFSEIEGVQIDDNKREKVKIYA
jgi:hypothetical protein